MMSQQAVNPEKLAEAQEAADAAVEAADAAMEAAKLAAEKVAAVRSGDLTAQRVGQPGEAGEGQGGRLRNGRRVSDHSERAAGFLCGGRLPPRRGAKIQRGQRVSL
jgi:hypothetical protein